MAKRIAYLGVYVALAMIFSYIEVLLPFSFGIPGVKLGIANIVVVTGLYLLRSREVFLILLVRILLMGLLFGNVMTLLYSLAGGLLSFVFMAVARRLHCFSMTGVSILGGAAHNMGQLMVAIAVFRSAKLINYGPVLLVAGILTGAFIGFLSQQIVKVLNGQTEV